VKQLAHAKTRLAVDPTTRRRLALSFAVDTLASVAACPLVRSAVIVTSDPVVEARLASPFAHVTQDPGCGLSIAVASGWAAATSWQPRSWVVVVPADLPALRPDDLSRVLEFATSMGGGFVPDVDGTGTTLLVAGPTTSSVARYGPTSAAAHLSCGLPELAAPRRARRDVDTVGDLVEAVALGVGAATARVLATSRNADAEKFGSHCLTPSAGI
jgi:2-phospho-L-lactate guanylyltransferase